ncbi:MAG: hypothetical protein ACYDA5_08320 [Vulcanimicrobiaceae bacterium]
MRRWDEQPWLLMRKRLESAFEIEVRGTLVDRVGDDGERSGA